MAWEIFERQSRRYEHWYDTPQGRRADRSECALLDRLLGLFEGADRALEIGCGTGHFTSWLSARGLRAVGLDRSPAMLREAQSARIACPLVLADAHRLPLDDGTVDIALLVTTLEFLESPAVALAESMRVATQGVVVVALNRCSVGGASRRWGRSSRSPLLGSAHDYSLGRLEEGLRSAAGERLQKLHWRSSLLPRPFDRLLAPIPFGDVLGVAAVLKPPSHPPGSRSTGGHIGGSGAPDSRVGHAV